MYREIGIHKNPIYKKSYETKIILLLIEVYIYEYIYWGGCGVFWNHLKNLDK